MQLIAEKFIKFYRKAYLTPYGEVFDIGNGTRIAIERMEEGMPSNQCGGHGENDNGNGSLMRILPLAYYLQEAPPMQRIEIIEDVSSLTHAHKRSKLACIIYVEYVINLIKGHDKYDSYQRVIDFIHQNCYTNYSGEIVNFSRILDGDISVLEENTIASTGYVVDTLEASLWSFMTTNDYKEAIYKGINLGGDTDTIAAIIGGMAGVFYGIRAIPETWINCLAQNQKINNMIEKFINQLDAK